MQQETDPQDMRHYGIGPLLVVFIAAAAVLWVMHGAFRDTFMLGLGAGDALLGGAWAMAERSSARSRVLEFAASGCFLAAVIRSIAVCGGLVHPAFAVMACFGTAAAVVRLARLVTRKEPGSSGAAAVESAKK